VANDCCFDSVFGHDKMRLILTAFVKVMASSIIVTDRDSLAANFAENSVNVLCQAAFGAGAYAIGSGLLGIPPVSAPVALVTGGALLAALTFCPSGGASQDDIFGSPPQFAGGQCATAYRFTAVIFDRTGFASAVDGSFSGAAAAFYPPYAGPVAGRAITVVNAAGRQIGNSNGLSGSDGAPYRVGDIVVSRLDGLPDNCGSLPSSGGQIITNNITGDTIDNSKVENNQNSFQIIPVFIDVGGINASLNLKFGPIQIEKLLPLEFNIDIGGANFKFGEDDDGRIKPRGTNPDKDAPNDKIEKLLKEIKECVCGGSVELETFSIPFSDAAGSCDLDTIQVEVPKGSVPPGAENLLLNSAVAAKERCENRSPEQLEESQIFAATITVGGAEIFTGLIDNDVISLRIQIDAFDPELLQKITLYPDSNQRKFGSVSYVGASVNGGGDYIYVFDQSTYVPLPKRGKKGRLRILFKPGTSFRVFDTGERL
jgi:hypothetical protein